MSPSEGQRRICVHKPSHRANTVSDRHTVRHDIGPHVSVEPLWSGPGPAATDDEGA
ncbi:hypothetical protein [Mycobacterium sp.]|uniref:hypothetical protein n=1 Tax=Mycobacterium sp. TaxID=1785 RepID=UPI003F800D66